MKRHFIYHKVKNELQALSGYEINDPDQGIFTSGILNSLNMLNLILFLESEFDLQINPFDVNLQMLGTLNRICDFVETRSKTQ